MNRFQAISLSLSSSFFVFGGTVAAEIAAPTGTAAQDLMTCVRTLASKPEFADISGKLPLQDMKTISFSMLADESLPAPAERKEIADWFDEREKCWRANEAALQAQWPPELFQLANEGSASIKAIGVDLFNRKLTYGQANKQIAEVGNSINARIIPIVKQYQIDIAAQNAAIAKQDEQRRDATDRRVAQQEVYANEQSNRAEELRLQRAKLFLNYMHANQQQAQLPQLTPSVQTNCRTVGTFTNCVTH